MMICRLIEKKRQPVSPVHFTRPYRWKQVQKLTRGIPLHFLWVAQ